MDSNAFPQTSFKWFAKVPRCQWLVACASVLLVGLPDVLHAGQGLRRTQAIPLSKGWNAVFLEVEPDDTSPAKVFSGLPVDKAATLVENPTTNQFVSDSAIDLSKSGGWGIWYSAELPESFLKSLDAIHGNQAYLVHAKEGCVWQAVGSATQTIVKWRSDAYNLVGFPVRTPGGPTFGQFFAGSPAHVGQKIYRLVNGRWKQVLQPTTQAMKSGEAFWIFCEGRSEYQGPLRVEAPSRLGLLLGRGGNEIILRNNCPHPLNPTVEHVPGASPAVPLSVIVRTFGDPADPTSTASVPMPAAAWSQTLPPLESGDGFAIPFECRAAEMVRPEQASLLKITTDLGTETWVPVRGFRDDLED
ncbi:hypothetical protein [Haloferula helveola]|uniref:hypothetical protein n=1 Tax=Haloferula helveola TaxID=490095 RepID=UPI0030D2EB7A